MSVKFYHRSAGKGRSGKPRTQEERRARHKVIYGTGKLPKRGTGLGKRR